MAHWKSLIERDYLGSWDLVGKDDKPRDFTLEIESVQSVKVKSREVPKGKRKLVIRFRGAEKAFIGNATNCETIEAMYGADPHGWIGKRITLYSTMVRSPKGGTILGIRVRPKVPAGKAEGIESRPVDPEVRAAQDEAFERQPGED